jgi:DNA-binding MarR family transcriptional regulator
VRTVANVDPTRRGPGRNFRGSARAPVAFGTVVQDVNSSRNAPPRGHPRRAGGDRFEDAFRRCATLLAAADDPDLTADHLRLLGQLTDAPGGVALTWLAEHLGWPKSTTSVAVKDLERRGYVRRGRRDDDERRLWIALTPDGRSRVAADRLLDPDRLGAALRTLAAPVRAQLIDALEELARAAASLPNRST